MKSLRHAVLLTLSVLVLLAASGCRTAGVDSFTRRDPAPKRVERTAVQLLDEHNKNALRVLTLEARPSITVTGRIAGGVNGQLALERPRNFKLKVSSTLHDFANIGSNDEEFWFWLKDAPEKAVYYCNYDETEGNPLAASLQPDWIVEALGLRVIPEEDAAKIKVTPGKEPGTLILTSRQSIGGGDALLKETILNEATHQIREHFVYSPDRKTLLAHAVVMSYGRYTPRAEPGASAEPVTIPNKLRLDWTFQDKVSLDVTLKDVKVNEGFAQARRDLLFVEPKIAGSVRKNIVELAGGANMNPPTSVRETMPAPPRVNLSAPSPLGLDGTRPASGDVVALSSSEGPVRSATALEPVVGAPIPRASDPTVSQTDRPAPWGAPFGNYLDR